MRDLATYEVNFAQDHGSGSCRHNLQRQVDNLIDVRVKLKQNVAFNEDGEAFFTDKTVAMQEDGLTLEQSYDSEIDKSLEHQKRYLKTREIDLIYEDLVSLQQTKKRRNVQKVATNDLEITFDNLTFQMNEICRSNKKGNKSGTTNQSLANIVESNLTDSRQNINS